MIPEQLDSCRFILLGGKCSIETAWQVTEQHYEQHLDKSWIHKETGVPYIIKKTGKIYYGPLHNYSKNDSTLLNHKANYGVLTGLNQLGVLDDDTLDHTLMKLFEQKFGKSFRVRDHYYIRLKGWDGKKIIFYNPETSEHEGELQGLGQQVVGPGNIHPDTAEVYDIREDLPIKEIQILEFLYVFGGRVRKKEEVKRIFKRTTWQGDDIKNIPISSIISLGNLRNDGGNYQGSHPYHNSTTGMNFRVNTSNNVWYCFRCQSGGGPAELIAVMEGITDCSQIGPRCFSEEQSRELIRIAREKYGLKNPADNLEPRGWACSISIKRFAQRHNKTTCKCGKDFEFNDKLGWFKCSCGNKGNLKDFAKLVEGVIQ